MPGPFDDWDDITPGKSSRSTQQPTSSPYDDWEDVSLQQEPEIVPEDPGFGSGYGIPSLRDIYSTALKIPGQLIETGVGALDYAATPWRSMNPGIPTLSKALRPLGYDPEGWEKEISEREDSPELKAAQQRHARAKGGVETAVSYWRNPGLAALDIESSALPMYIGGAAGRGFKAVTGLGPLLSGAVGEGALTAAQQTADITREKGDFTPQDFWTTTGSAATTAAISGAGGRIANRLDLPDVEQMLADKAVKGSRRVLPVLGAMGNEALEEGAQSYQEQVATNIATGKPWSEGAGSAAVSGAVSGGIMSGGMSMYRGGHDAGVKSPDLPDPILGENEEYAGDVIPVPHEQVNGEFIAEMRDQGFEQVGIVPGGKVLFKRINSPDITTDPTVNEGPDLAGGAEINPPPPPLPNQVPPPLPTPFGQGEGAQPGETTGRVAPMPASADQALNTILNTRDEATVDAAANDFVQRVSKISNPQQLTRMLQSIQLQPQTAVTKALIDVVARRLETVAPGMDYTPNDPLADTTNPNGRGNFGNEAWEETPDDAARNGPEGIVPPPFDAGTYTEEDRARMAENLRQMLSPAQTNVQTGQFGQGTTDLPPGTETGRVAPIVDNSLDERGRPKQVYHYVEEMKTRLLTGEDIEDIADSAEALITNETDPEVIKDNFETLDQYADTAASPDEIEHIGFLRDVALDKARQIGYPPQATAPQPTNVAQFPEQPSGELRDFHKDLMGQVQSRGAELQQRAVELRQTYPNATDEQIRNVINIQNNINRRREKGSNPAQQEELLARVVAALQAQEAAAPKSGPTGIVPPTQSGVENLRQQAVQGQSINADQLRETALDEELNSFTPPDDLTVTVPRNELTPEVRRDLEAKGYMQSGNTRDGQVRFTRMPIFSNEDARRIIDRAMPQPGPEPQPATEFGQDPIDQQIAEWERSQDGIIRQNQEANGPLMQTPAQIDTASWKDSHNWERDDRATPGMDPAEVNEIFARLGLQGQVRDPSGNPVAAPPQARPPEQITQGGGEILPHEDRMIHFGETVELATAEGDVFWVDKIADPARIRDLNARIAAGQLDIVQKAGGISPKNVTPTQTGLQRVGEQTGSLMSPDPASPVRSTDAELAQLYTMMHGRPPQTMADLDQLRGIDLSIDAEKYGNERNALDAPITDEDIAMEDERAALEGPINLTTEEKAALTRNKARLFERLAGRNVTKDAMTDAPITGEVLSADPTQYGPKGEGFLRRTLSANPNLSPADISQMHEFLVSLDAPVSGDIEGGGLEKVAEQAGMPSFEEAKADLDARQDAGEVTDYEEELAALHESYGVIDTMSNEMTDYVDKVQRAMKEGYKVYPAGYKADPDEPVAYTFESEGQTFRAVGYRHLVTPDNPTGRNIKPGDTKQLGPGEDIEFMAKSKRPYVDTSPDVHKRYEVYDENDNLIDKTYDHDEAQRWADQYDGYVKDTGEPDAEFMAKDPYTGKAQIRVNVAHSAAELTSGYSKPLPFVMTREGLQNSLDAVKDMGTNGEITVNLTEQAYNKPGTIEIIDNGKGMSRAELYTVYTTLHESGKANDPGATGGKGVGKATYMLGGDHFEVETVKQVGKDKIKSSFSGTPPELMAGFHIHSEVVDPSTPTGTKFKTTLKQDQDAYYAREVMDYIIDYSRNRPGNLNLKRTSYDNYTVHNLMGNSKDKKIATNVNIGHGNSDADIYIPEKAKIGSSGSVLVHVLNNGMWQFKQNMYLSGGVTNGVPSHVVVDLKPNKAELDPDYPFPVQRESVKDDIWRSIEAAVNDKVVNPMAGGRKRDLVKLWNQMTVTPRGVEGNVRESTIFDPGDRLTPTELRTITNSSTVIGIQRVVDNFTDEILRNIGDTSSIAKLVRTGLMMSEQGFYGVHIPNPGAPKAESAILINWWNAVMDHPNSPEDAARFIKDIIFHEAAHVKTQAGPHAGLKMSPDDLADPRLGEYLAGYLNEVAEQGGVDQSHGADFIRRLGEVYGKARVADSYYHINILESILRGGSESGGYGPEIPELLRIYQESRRRTATTEDILSPTGVKSANRRSKGEGSVRGNNAPVGDGTPAKSAVELFRLKFPPVNDYESTRWILPDGTRLGFGDPLQWHSSESYRAGIPLDEALENGIVRFRNSAAETHGPITAAQAAHIADSPYMLEREYIVMDVMGSDGNRRHTVFEKGTKAGKIRAWVNAQFQRLITEEEGSLTIPSWSQVKQTTGWGQGVKPPTPRAPRGQPALPQQTNWVKEALAVPAGMTTTLDLSAPFRQGLSMIHTPQFWKAAGKMFGGLTEAGFNAIDADLRSKPVMRPRINSTNGKVMPSIAKEAGLKMFETASQGGMNQRAQATASRWLEQGIGQGVGSKIWRNTAGVPIRMSNRAYITFLNHLKVNRFEYLMDQSAKMHQDVRNTGQARPGLFKQNFTQQQGVELNGYRNKLLAKELADFVNTATGQGPLKTHILPFKQTELSLESAAGALTHIMFSPGLFASRVRMLNPSTYVMATPQVRKQYMMSALATGAAWTAALALIKGGGGDDVEVGTEMTSADFGKAKIGDTRLDPGGGFQQFLVAMARMIKGGTTSSASGDWREFGEGFNAPTQWSNLERFMSNKLNPVTKFAYDLLSQSEYNPFHVKDRLAQLFVPLVIQDLIGLYYENPKMLPWMAPILFGMGTQTYGRGESVGKLVAPENDWLATGGGVVDILGKDEEQFDQF